jgi:hypothetical protein
MKTVKSSNRFIAFISFAALIAVMFVAPATAQAPSLHVVNVTGSGVVTDIDGNEGLVDFRINATIHDKGGVTGNVFFSFSEEFSAIWGVYPGTRKIQLEGRVAEAHLDEEGRVHLSGVLVERDFVRGQSFVAREEPFSIVIDDGVMELLFCELPLFVIDLGDARVRLP